MTGSPLTGSPRSPLLGATCTDVHVVNMPTYMDAKDTGEQLTRQIYVHTYMYIHK